MTFLVQSYWEWGLQDNVRLPVTGGIAVRSEDRLSDWDIRLRSARNYPGMRQKKMYFWFRLKREKKLAQKGPPTHQKCHLRNPGAIGICFPVSFNTSICKRNTALSERLKHTDTSRGLPFSDCLWMLNYWWSRNLCMFFHCFTSLRRSLKGFIHLNWFTVYVCKQAGFCKENRGTQLPWKAVAFCESWRCLLEGGSAGNQFWQQLRMPQFHNACSFHPLVLSIVPLEIFWPITHTHTHTHFRRHSCCTQPQVFPFQWAQKQIRMHFSC